VLSASLTSQAPDDAKPRQAVLDELGQRQPTPRLVTRPEAREALAPAMRHRTDPLGRLWVGDPRQRAVAAAAWPAAPERWVSQWPPPLTTDGLVKGRVRTAPGHPVPLWVTASRRQGQRRAGQCVAGVSAALGL
jgi:hypothetical protein